MVNFNETCNAFAQPNEPDFISLLCSALGREASNFYRKQTFSPLFLFHSSKLGALSDKAY